MKPKFLKTLEIIKLVRIRGNEIYKKKENKVIGSLRIWGLSLGEREKLRMLVKCEK